jgi:hypothetical protein
MHAQLQGSTSLCGQDPAPAKGRMPYAFRTVFFFTELGSKHIHRDKMLPIWTCLRHGEWSE